MSFLSDLLLAAGAFGAALFCLILSRRLKALTALDSGMGAAVAVLSAQVDDLTKAIRRAQDAAEGSAGRLSAQTARAEAACRKLELLVAAMHDLPGEGAPAPGSVAAPVPESTPSSTPLRSRILRRRAAERAA
jgi:hypothetical protein